MPPGARVTSGSVGQGDGAHIESEDERVGVGDQQVRAREQNMDSSRSGWASVPVRTVGASLAEAINGRPLFPTSRRSDQVASTGDAGVRPAADCVRGVQAGGLPVDASSADPYRSYRPELEGIVMAEAGLFIGWGQTVRGREAKGLGVFGDAVNFWTA